MDDMDDINGMIDIHIIHGGGFRDMNTYIGGETKILEDIEWVMFELEDLEDAVKSLGYHSILKYAFRGLGIVTYKFFTDAQDFNSEFHKYIDEDKRKITIHVQCLNDDWTIARDEGTSKLGECKSNEKKCVSMGVKRINLLDQSFESDSDNETVVSSYEASDDSYCSLSSEEEFGYRRSKRNVVRRRYKPHIDLKNLVFAVGMEFKDRRECQEVIRDWAIVNGYNIRWKKSEDRKVEARCDGGCPWTLYASKLAHEVTFVIKTLLDQHTCVRKSVNRQATKEWLAGILKPVLKRNANYPAKDIVQDVQLKYGIMVTTDACYKAKWKALRQMRGTFESHYKQLRPYMTYLHQMDREGKFLLKTRLDEDERPVFERAYIGFSSLRKGFFRACRRLICFDACFLKSPLGGCLLAAVGKDCNNKMWPISWAVVEKECQNSWTWFFEILFEDLNITDGLGWTFMSDKHLGIINGIHNLVPNAEHRHCARHIYANWKKVFPGPQLRDLFWAAVMCTTEADFKFRCSELKNHSEEAYNQFMAREPRKFCRSLISSHTRTNMIENNICETFNSYILRSRDKPIIEMLEDIRLRLMTRMPEIVRQLNTCSDILCPSVGQKLSKLQQNASNCLIKRAIGNKFEVHAFDDVVIVDLIAKDCSCRTWNLTGIPCFHGLACIRHVRDDPVNYIDEFYYRTNCLEAYNTYYLSPIGGPREWPVVDAPPILPPPYEKQPGRPKKNRRKDPSEEPSQGKQKWKNTGSRMSCSRCKLIGHNVRTCKIVAPEHTTNEPIQKKVGRPRKTTSVAHERDMRQARMGFGVLTGESGNIYIRPPGANRTKVLKCQNNCPSESSQIGEKPSQSSQVLDE